jgi:hypothetical protein
MATITSASFSSPTHRRAGPTKSSTGIRDFWHQLFARAFDPYRPELHYMRGPGPACRAKQMALSPAVQSMLTGLQAAKAREPSARS